MPDPANPLIVQSDRTVLLEVDNDRYEPCRDALAAFAELVKSPEHIHTYRVSPLSLWNARAASLTVEQILSALAEYSKYDLPGNVITDIRDYAGRFGRLTLLKDDGRLVLQADDRLLATELWHHKQARPLFIEQIDPRRLAVHLLDRGRLKQTLIKIGFPIEDLAGYVDGEHLDLALRPILADGTALQLRHYQNEAANSFWAAGGPAGGSGVLVLPCGAGKTVIAMDVLAKAQTSTLILTTGITASNQWKRELLDKTTLTDREIGLYSGEHKEIRPVTLATYQVMTYRRRGEFIHLELFNQRNWGLIVYDEVHLLPAPVFRVTAEIQAKRRLGLTATLVREDHREDDVFSLIGPKKCDVPWKVLEKQGWIATASCHEIRLPLAEDLRLPYAVGDPNEKFRIASCNPGKFDVVERLLERHQSDQILIIGQFLEQLEALAGRLQVPLITGKTPTRDRERLYQQFRDGEINRLVVSKVANFAIDLPDANVAIQISGTFGSRQEEAQRLGRILRPKSEHNQAHFYTLVTRDSRDHDFAVNRQLFLTEQGYQYEILDAADLDGGRVPGEDVPSNVIAFQRRLPSASGGVLGRQQAGV
ncbi:MAG TPA: DNA repair helicase XPB [Chloroflexota bacterium]|jgi:DNA excision repair protein ERCC-3